MRPNKQTPAHQTGNCAELVCSNTFRSDELENAVGLLHEEMRQLNAIIMQSADKARIPAGSALAVDREQFAEIVTVCMISNLTDSLSQRFPLPMLQVRLLCSMHH